MCISDTVKFCFAMKIDGVFFRYFLKFDFSNKTSFENSRPPMTDIFIFVYILLFIY